MANIKNTRDKFHDKIGKGFDIPSEHVESEGERLIKQLTSKQINTKINLIDELNREQQFESSSVYLPLTQFTSGQLKLEQFNHIKETFKNRAYLYEYGLNDDEIEFYSNFVQNADLFYHKYKNIERNAIDTRLNIIQNKLECKNVDNKGTSSSKIPEREEVELALSVKPQSTETKLYKFALLANQIPNHQDKKSFISRDHPLNSLKQIENDLFHKPSVPSIEKRRKRARKFLDNQKSESTQLKINSESAKFSIHLGKKTKWDIKDPLLVKEVNKNARVYTCKSRAETESLYRVQEGEIKRIGGGLEKSETEKKLKDENLYGYRNQSFVSTGDCTIISIEHIQKYKLAVDQIKKMPKFENYQPGEPSQTLFLKNLSNKITESDLVQIFGNFQRPEEKKITYRLMSGRMKGQAFITFTNVERAKEALETVNGFIFDERPMILQYGRK